MNLQKNILTIIQVILFCSASAHSEDSNPELIFNQDLQDSWASRALDVTNVDDVFDHVFSRLPDTVVVYPSENYYYWKLFTGGMQIWGNFRLPAGARDRGVLSFGYYEFREFPTGGIAEKRRRVSGSKYFTKADGVEVKKLDEFRYSVNADSKTVEFVFHQLDQSAPKKFELRKNEIFVQNTFDESGLQFHLMANTKTKYFFWVLNEEEKIHVPENFRKVGEDVMLGLRTGFVFLVDEDRKVLGTIRRQSVQRNDYYDGPFDQLADNYARQTEIQSVIGMIIPSMKGRIDEHGYYLDRDRPLRIALSNYGAYEDIADALTFLEKARSSFDPIFYISRRGIPRGTVSKARGTGLSPSTDRRSHESKSEFPKLEDRPSEKSESQ